MIGNNPQHRADGFRSSAAAWMFCVVAISTGAACGETADTGVPSSPSGSDADVAMDSSPPVEAGALDGLGSPDAAVSIDVVVPRCEAASYDTSPSGAACNPKRIVRLRGLVGPCFGPALGATCMSLQIAVPAGQEGALPVGFVCGSAELGIKTCTWTFSDDAGSWHSLDADALEAACAVTLAFPNEDLLCVNGGS